MHCTINTSDTELMLRTYMVTPTSTGGPVNNAKSLLLRVRLSWVLLSVNNCGLRFQEEEKNKFFSLRHNLRSAWEQTRSTTLVAGWWADKKIATVFNARLEKMFPGFSIVNSHPARNQIRTKRSNPQRKGNYIDLVRPRRTFAQV